MGPKSVIRITIKKNERGNTLNKPKITDTTLVMAVPLDIGSYQYYFLIPFPYFRSFYEVIVVDPQANIWGGFHLIIGVKPKKSIWRHDYLVSLVRPLELRACRY